jgi:outer membrane protein insertion porin family
LSVAATPPYSLWDGKDYASMSDDSDDKFRMIEYHKWKFKAKIYSPLTPLSVKRTPVLMTRVEYGFLGSYDKNKRSPFETFYMGGDGMSGYSSTYATETIGLRGYENGSIADLTDTLPMDMLIHGLAMELRYPFFWKPSSTIYGWCLRKEVMLGRLEIVQSVRFETFCRHRCSYYMPMID